MIAFLENLNKHYCDIKDVAFCRVYKTRSQSLKLSKKSDNPSNTTFLYNLYKT